MTAEPIYLDHHSTTPCDPRVVEAMLPYFTDVFGNAASQQHGWGRAAGQAVETARQDIAALLGTEAKTIVLTSGATESDNLAIKGVVEAAAGGRSTLSGLHLVTANTEHKAVLDSCASLEARGLQVTYLPVEADGRVLPERVEEAIRPETVLVSLMLANNEIGVVHPIPDIAAVCKRRNVLLHTDASQALAQLDCRVDHLGIDLMSISAHKAYGPKGVGALFLRPRRPKVRLLQQQDGGDHEQGRRSGSLNVPGIVGFGAACRLIHQQRAKDAQKLNLLRNHLLTRLQTAFPRLEVNGSLEHRLPNNLNVSIPGLISEKLFRHLDTVALSAGAACSAPGLGGSYVIKALSSGLSPTIATEAVGARADSSLRFGLGRFTTSDEIERASKDLIAAISEQLRSPSGVDDRASGASGTCGG